MELRWLIRLTLAIGLAQATFVPELAKSQTSQSQDLAPFLTGALSVATLQARASGIIVGREAVPEAKKFAQQAVEFRRAHIEQIHSIAKQRDILVGSEPTFEQRVILQNLAPLEFLALSRRYAELQVDALEFELAAYAKAAASPEPTVKEFLIKWHPQLDHQLSLARQMLEAVRR